MKKNNNKNNIKTLLEIFITFGLVIGMLFGAMNYFAKAEDLKLTQLRLDQKILEDRTFTIQAQMWELERRNGGPDIWKWKNEEDRVKYQNLKRQLDLLQKRLDKSINMLPVPEG